jgi:uncharacterized protein YndB with AHSA1/START domain
VSVVQKNSRVQVVVDAAVEDVWQVVADVTRTGEWSHECRSAQWTGGAVAAAPGARFRGRNRTGWARWSRTCEIVAVDDRRELAWRTIPTLLYPDSTEWRIRLEPAGDGTTITQSFTVLRAPWLLDRLYARLLPSHQDRDARLTEDLARIGATARQAVRE